MRSLNQMALGGVRPSPMALALFSLFMAVLCFSIGNVITRFADVGPASTAFFRLFLAMPIMWFMMGVSLQSKENDGDEEYLPVLNIKVIGIGVLCGVLYGVEITFLHYAFTQGSVGVAVFLNNASPLLVCLGSWLFFSEKATGRTFLCLMFAIPGVLLLAGISDGFETAVSINGVIAALISAVLWAAYILTCKQLLRIQTRRQVANWTNIVACLSLLPIAFLTNEQFFPSTWEGWALLLSLAVIAQVIGMNLFTLALRTLSSTMTSIFGLLQPVLSALLAWWILGETLTTMQVVGACVVIGAVSINSKR